MASPSILRSTANRAVHLRITPRPSNIGESREMMRLLSQFGEIEYFKSLKHDALPAPDAALVIFKDEEAAQHCLKRSPIRFRMGRGHHRIEQMETEEVAQPAASKERHESRYSNSDRESRGPLANPFGVPIEGPRQARYMSTSARAQPESSINKNTESGDSSQKSSADIPDSRIYQIQTNIARANFRDLINASHFHGYFAIDGKSAAQQDLSKRVPILGLSDVNWRAEGKPWRVLLKEKERDGAFKWSGRRRALSEIWDEGAQEG